MERLNNSAKESELQAPETIDQYIDMNVVDFIKKVTEDKSFTEINSMIQLMDVEQVRLSGVRQRVAKEFATTKSNTKEFNTLFTHYVGTFVLEQKLIDRRDILGHIKTMKGVTEMMGTNKAYSTKLGGTSKATSIKLGGTDKVN